MPKYDIQLIIALRFCIVSALAGFVKRKRTQTHHHHTERKEKKRKKKNGERFFNYLYRRPLVIVKNPVLLFSTPPHPTSRSAVQSNIH